MYEYYSLCLVIMIVTCITTYKYNQWWADVPQDNYTRVIDYSDPIV